MLALSVCTATPKAFLVSIHLLREALSPGNVLDPEPKMCICAQPGVSHMTTCAQIHNLATRVHYDCDINRRFLGRDRLFVSYRNFHYSALRHMARSFTYVFLRFLLCSTKCKLIQNALLNSSCVAPRFKISETYILSGKNV